MSNKASIARSLLQRLASGGHCCPHHAAGDGGPICIAKNNHSHTTSGRYIEASKKRNDSGNTDYAFEMICSTLRFGPGVTREIGYDIRNLGARNTLLVTDKNVAKTRAFTSVVDSLRTVGAKFDVFDGVKVEPSDKSVQEAIAYARHHHFDSFIAVGGGSAIDTAKVAALYASNPEANFDDFIVAPFGKAKSAQKPMLPLIAVPTTAGTGSETTGVAILDLPEQKCKTGIRQRCIKPLLAIIDPLNVISMPRSVAIYSGFDVLCHALESYTSRPFNQRSPRPAEPQLRPVYQGSNPISDVWAREALNIIAKYFRRSVADADDEEARSQMLMASSFAGMGFGNSGVHLCHGLSYPISSQGKKYVSPDYDQSSPLIPHGLSVVITAVADFRFTACADPRRHADAARFLGADIGVSASSERIAETLADLLKGFMSDFRVPNGLSAMGFQSSDVDNLSAAAVNSLSAIQVAPRSPDRDAIAEIYQDSMTVY